VADQRVSRTGAAPLAGSMWHAAHSECQSAVRASLMAGLLALCMLVGAVCIAYVSNAPMNDISTLSFVMSIVISVLQDAMAGAPPAGAWFHDQFMMLVRNANPAVVAAAPVAPAPKPVVPAPKPKPTVKKPVVPAPKPKPTAKKPVVPAPNPKPTAKKPVVPAPKPKPTAKKPVVPAPKPKPTLKPKPKPTVKKVRLCPTANREAVLGPAHATETGVWALCIAWASGVTQSLSAAAACCALLVRQQAPALHQYTAS
jgi:hypothetical protein